MAITYRTTAYGGANLPLTNAQVDENFSFLDLNKTFTRFRGTTTGTLVSGDITLAPSTNIGITQVGNVITIDASNITSIGAATAASLVVTGNLTVNGTTTTINSTTLSVDDINIELGSVTTPTNTTANGGGITLKGTTDKTFNWINATSAWTSSENLNLLTGKAYHINGTLVLTSSALGSGITSSSLTSVGTITTGVWNGTTIAIANGGTGATTAAAALTSLGAYAASNPSGYISGITSANVTTALGFTPYNATNPSGYTTNTGTVTSVAALTIGTTGTDITSSVATGTTTPVITLNIPTASATNRGALSAADWTTFNNKTSNTGTVTNVSALTIGTTGADITSSVTSGTTTPVITLNIPTASASNRGALSAADWTTFNNKTSNTGTVTSVGGTGTVSGLSLSGTVTTTGNLTLSGTLAVTASNFASQTANTFLSAPNGLAGVPTFRAIVAADVPTLNQNTTGSAATLTTGRTISLTGDIAYTSGSFDGSANVTGTATLATVNANIGSFGGTTSIPVITVNAKGLITSITTTAITAGATLNDDTTTNASYYPTMSTTASGSFTTAKISSTQLYFNPSSGTLNSTSFNSLSDVRFKTDLVQISGALNKLEQLTGYTFSIIESNTRSSGLIAQDLQKVLPESVSGTEDKLTVNYGAVMGLIVEAIKELNSKVDAIKNQLLVNK